MENHPIPQDVTGFKFRLIGSITVKQFLYLLGAGAIALILYFMPIPIVIKIPCMFIPAVVGLSLAFVPIDGRPMDKMIANFAKTIPSENQYIYHKKGVDMPYFYFNPKPQHIKPAAAQQQQTSSAASDKALLFSKLSRTYFKPDDDEQKGIASLSDLFKNPDSPIPTQTKVVHADAIPPEVSSPAAPAPVIPPTPHAEADAKPHVAEPEKSIQQAAPPTPPAPAPADQAAPQAILGTMPAPSQFDAPNVIKGTVKDPRGKLLPHIIVEFLDENKIPQRTFRTNQNGAFAAATPMPNGTYTIHLEDTLKKQEFSDVTIELSGVILPPLEITSVDQREKLRQELFGVAKTAQA